MGAPALPLRLELGKVMEQNSRHTWKGVAIGIFISLVTAALLGVFPSISHWIKQDAQISFNTSRLDKIEPVIDLMKTDIALNNLKVDAGFAALNQRIDDLTRALRSGGYRGPQGVEGPQGVRGVQGFKGTQGIQGQRGKSEDPPPAKHAGLVFQNPTNIAALSAKH